MRREWLAYVAILVLVSVGISALWLQQQAAARQSGVERATLCRLISEVLVDPQGSNGQRPTTPYGKSLVESAERFARDYDCPPA